MTRGELIRQARERKNLSQEVVADRLSVSQQTYSNLEGDKIKNPKRNMLMKLGKILDIPIETLLFGPGWTPDVSESGRVVGQTYDKLSPERQARLATLLLKLQAEQAESDHNEIYLLIGTVREICRCVLLRQRRYDESSCETLITMLSEPTWVNAGHSASRISIGTYYRFFTSRTTL